MIIYSVNNVSGSIDRTILDSFNRMYPVLFIYRKIPSVHRMVLYIDTLQFIGCYCADLTVIFHGSYDGIV